MEFSVSPAFVLELRGGSFEGSLGGGTFLQLVVRFVDRRGAIFQSFSRLRV